MQYKFYPSFEEIPARQVYDLLKLRQDVFIIEQDCIYEDIDNIDFDAEHLLLLDEDELCGYLRIVPPGKKYKEVSIGRILVKSTHRGRGLGASLIQKAMDIISKQNPQPVRIEAQAHLESFYNRLGFCTAGEPYDLDGILHVEMLHPAS